MRNVAPAFPLLASEVVEELGHVLLGLVEPLVVVDAGAERFQNTVAVLVLVFVGVVNQRGSKSIDALSVHSVVLGAVEVHI